jgi:hypothetical protein
MNYMNLLNINFEFNLGPTGPRHMNPRAVQNNHNNNFKGNRTQR